MVKYIVTLRYDIEVEDVGNEREAIEHAQDVLEEMIADSYGEMFDSDYFEVTKIIPNGSEILAFKRGE